MAIDLIVARAAAPARSLAARKHILLAGAAETGLGRAIFWMDQLREGGGSFPHLEREILPAPCNHCENAPCTKVCPVGATYRNDEGIVAQIWARCIGCRFCTVACPYTRRYFNWEAPRFSEEEKLRLNPDVATRPVGVVEKCTLCHHRLRRLREDARWEGANWPTWTSAASACAQTCPAEAITSAI